MNNLDTDMYTQRASERSVSKKNKRWYFFGVIIGVLFILFAQSVRVEVNGSQGANVLGALFTRGIVYTSDRVFIQKKVQKQDVNLTPKEDVVTVQKKVYVAVLPKKKISKKENLIQEQDSYTELAAALSAVKELLRQYNVVVMDEDICDGIDLDIIKHSTCIKPFDEGGYAYGGGSGSGSGGANNNPPAGGANPPAGGGGNGGQQPPAGGGGGQGGPGGGGPGGGGAGNN